MADVYEVLEIGVPGPRGPIGLPGAPGGALVAAPAAVVLSGHMAVAYAADGSLVPASADDAAQLLVVAGITTGAAAAGAVASVQRSGVLEHSGWSWTPGAPVLVGLGGALVQVLPAGAVVAQVVGRALGPMRLLVAIQPPVVLA